MHTIEKRFLKFMKKPMVTDVYLDALFKKPLFDLHILTLAVMLCSRAILHCSEKYSFLSLSNLTL